MVVEMQVTKHLEMCIRRGALEQNAHNFNQTMRGLHFLYADFLMTQTYPNAVFLGQAVRYLRLHMDYARKYLSEFDCSFSKVKMRLLSLKRRDFSTSRKSRLPSPWATTKSSTH